VADGVYFVSFSFYLFYTQQQQQIADTLQQKQSPSAAAAIGSHRTVIQHPHLSSIGKWAKHK
jgi:hypothetical protein